MTGEKAEERLGLSLVNVFSVFVMENTDIAYRITTKE